MDDLINQLIQLDYNDFRVVEYKPVHSVLTLLATKTETNKRARLAFSMTEYIEMPMFWKGRFTLASDDEYILIAEKSEFERDFERMPVSAFRKSINLYRVERACGTIYILGNISSIEIED